MGIMDMDEEQRFLSSRLRLLGFSTWSMIDDGDDDDDVDLLLLHAMVFPYHMIMSMMLAWHDAPSPRSLCLTFSSLYLY